MSSKAHFCQQWVVNSRSLGRAFPYFYPNLESKNGLVEPKVKKILCGLRNGVFAYKAAASQSLQVKTDFCAVKNDCDLKEHFLWDSLYINASG